MLYSDEAVFIHVPKTGGMSVTRFLVNALDTPVVLFAAGRSEQHLRNLSDTEEAAAKLRLVVGRRHARCPDAADEIRAAGLPLPPVAFSIVREPVSLMISYYRYMQSPKVWKLRGMEPGNLRGAPKLAMELGFDDFLGEADFYGMNDAVLREYYIPADFACLDIVALEHLGDYLGHRFGHHRAFDLDKLEHRNSSKGVKIDIDVTDTSRRLIADKYPLLTETHRGALDRNWASGKPGYSVSP